MQSTEPSPLPERLEGEAPTRSSAGSERYDVREEIARGGMGIVFRVYDRVAGEYRALKRARTDDVSRSPYFIEAFEREYQVLAGLAHPRIIRVYDFGRDEEGPYYTMELLEGDDLRAIAPLPFREACFYLRDVATSLSLLHTRRLLHRDISPNNVRKTPDGHCKLIDFGALHAFGSTDVIVGTPPAVPPEALDSMALDQRADLYALGALAYWVLTGRHAYDAKSIDDLPRAWESPPAPPSTWACEIPGDLDKLVLSLLSHDLLARPGSAGEVIARLNNLAGLSREEDGDTGRLAESFLANPPFTGRSEELGELARHTRSALSGIGAAVRIEGIAGSGRTRLLDEAVKQAQQAGATPLRVDASTVPQAYGTVRALVRRLFEALPVQAQSIARRHRQSLKSLGAEVENRLRATPSVFPPSELESGVGSASDIHVFLLDVSREQPLVVAVDNVEYVDGPSLSVLVALAIRAHGAPLLLLTSERTAQPGQQSAGLISLAANSTTLTLGGLMPLETLALARSLFGDAPNLERFSEWLHDSAAGSPLHCIEITRQLLARDVVRYFGGIWALPVERPEAELPAALEDALASRCTVLSPEGRRLAECLSLQREQPTFALCAVLCEAERDEARARELLAELAQHDVLHEDHGRYRFSSLALREALSSRIDDRQRAAHHRRLGAAFVKLADDGAELLLEAGWHLIQGGDEIAGAELIANITSDSVRVRTLIANLYRAGRPCEAALRVYKYYRRSTSARMPLLAALAHAGYYEDRALADRYGDDALDALEGLAGLTTARRLTPVIGGRLALAVGLLLAWIRFMLTPKAERTYGFHEILVQLTGVVSALTGVAAISLDRERAERVAHTLAPFAVLSERDAGRGIYDFCVGLAMITREQAASAYRTLDCALTRFKDPTFYRALPPDGRHILIAASNFARGSLSVFRADGRVTLESADELDASGFKLYALIASQLRYLYHVSRGEFVEANTHREQVELHAAHVGSAWQVEVWESAALTMVLAQEGDAVALSRLQDRLEIAKQGMPSLSRYHRRAQLALGGTRAEHPLPATSDELEGSHAPRSFIGWATYQGLIARDLNACQEHERALEVCDLARSQMEPADREYVTMFLPVLIQHALACAGLGRVDEARLELEALLVEFEPSQHPFALGLLHEALLQISAKAGQRDAFEHHARQMERWFRPTRSSALIARCEQIQELRLDPSETQAEIRNRKDASATSSARAAAEQAGSAKTVRSAPRREPSV